MNKDQWQQIEKIFYAAMELPRDERKAFLNQACAGDEELLREVQALLMANQDAESFLDSPVNMPPHSGTFSPTLVMPHPEAKTGAAMESGVRIGAYRLIREIGRGGMGAVWLAERADGQFYQQVAIKLLHAGSENEEVIRRFRHERQILASLDHPNIARLLDGGTTEDGRPYFVMEYIEGLPVDEYCRQHQLSVNDRLRLFRQVCAAVHYAHQNLVIHRDLKPSNIAVTEDGTPKLLDFGIAKLIQPDLSRSYDTLSGVTPMTPAYASPEQVRGEKLTTASDVYSLGVVLYELLTGRSPYRLKASAFGELMRAIIEQEPERPSTAITRADGAPPTNPITIEPTEKLRRRLSGDIDSIVLMALRKEPPSRYGSVEQFSEDLRRYLEGLPTAARRGTFGYRALKYIRRNKVPVAAAALILLSLLGGIGATLRQARIAKAAQLQAESQRNRAEAALLTAEERRQQADAARAEANQQRDEAEAQRSFAEDQQLRAEAQELSNRRLLYTSQMALANTAWNESNVERVRELLIAHIPKPGEPDLRGFEWHYLWRISHTEVATLQQTPFSQTTAFSPDGRKLVSVTKDGTIKQWDTSTWKEMTSSKWENLDGAFSPTFSADKKLVAARRVSGRETNTPSIGIWEVATGKLLKSFVPAAIPALAARSFAFSTDGKYLAIGFYRGQIVIFEIATGKEFLNFQGRSQQVSGLTYSPDGAKLVSVDLEGFATLWDARSGKDLMTYRSSSAAAYSSDGRFWGASGSNGSVVIRDAQTNKELKTLAAPRGVMTLAFSPDGKKLAAGGVEPQIRVWETETWNELTVIKGHGNPINMLTFSDNGQRLVSGSRDGVVKIWDLGKRQTPQIYCGSGGISDIAFTPDGNKLIVASHDQSFTVRDIVTGNKVYSRQAHNRDEKISGGHPLVLLPAPNRQRFITRGDDGLALWSISTGKELLRIKPRQETAAMAITSDGRLLAANYRGGGNIQIWEARTGDELFRLHVESPVLPGMVFLPDNRTLVTGFNDLVFLDVRTRQEVKKVRTNSQGIFSMKLSPDGRTIAIGSNRGSVSLHDATTGQEIFTLKGHGSAVNDLAFSPDGKRLASSSADNSRLWDLTTGQEVFTLPPAYKIAFSPDGRQLAAAVGGIVRLYSTVEMGNTNASCL